MVERNSSKQMNSEIEEEVGVASNNKWFVYYTTRRSNKTDTIPKKTLTHLRIDSSVREIPSGEFEGCKALVHLQLPDTLEIIGIRAFAYCSELKCIQFISSSDGSLQTYSLNNPIFQDGLAVFRERARLQISECAFACCNSLRKVVFCSVSTRLGKGVFYNCEGLISVELPEGLQVIESSLFADCESLTTVSIPSSVIRIGGQAFNRCHSLSSVHLLCGLEEIGIRSFYECASLEALHIPSTVSSIGCDAFSGCRSLRHLVLAPSSTTTTVSVIGDGAFSECRCLSHIRIPPSVERIMPTAFLSCDSLISIELPEGTLFDIDLSQSRALVNVACPPIHQSMFSRNLFFKHSKLGLVDNNKTKLIHRLKHRFDHSPLNKLCYYQSYHSSEDAMQQLRCLMEDDPLAATNQTDLFGMTPLHILSLSQTPNLDMLLAVMKEGNMDHIIRGRDSFGSTAMDYLCLNRMPSSTEVIRRVLYTRFEYWLGLNRSWNSDMCQAIDDVLAVDFSSRRREIVSIYLKLANYERKVMMSLLELRFWKSGGAVFVNVLQFLDTLEVEDYFADPEETMVVS
eukprot:scaffold7354_cov93-Cylindrotheca_fusiformis.AAC.2